MAKHKIISVSISNDVFSDSKRGVKVQELDQVKEYLEEGWLVRDIKNVSPPAGEHWTSIFIILTK
ncbi:hypothetical protein [Saccharicrinis sp. FJH54]|uniref:hypothetical protein n=1 Tax=Saccharicrinis sp. FJH54 TaxID=3344665 RepID=UPI0035D4405E